MGRSGKHRARPGTQKRMRKSERRAARARHAWDREVTRAFGDRGHRQCGRKARYCTKEMAEAVARRRKALGGPTLRCYPCDICGGWHLTSAPKMQANDDTTNGRAGR